ncbi:Npun_F0494 family protein [Allocoleopsis sp.]|uniref:Npun_F0494 family protein n=1 Tax=Allocoleopsis sp. TaxID=3088169 RepID=UPI002FCFD531
MTSLQPLATQSIQYSASTLKRAERAIRCLPFQLPLLAAMRSHSVPLQAIAGQGGVENRYTKQPMSELAIESGLLWLIQVGILRREVDGQGITDSFRLTPLGRHLVERWENQGGTLPPPSFLDRLYNAVSRWLRLPF